MRPWHSALEGNRSGEKRLAEQLGVVYTRLAVDCSSRFGSLARCTVQRAYCMGNPAGRRRALVIFSSHNYSPSNVCGFNFSLETVIMPYHCKLSKRNHRQLHLYVVYVHDACITVIGRPVCL